MPAWIKTDDTILRRYLVQDLLGEGAQAFVVKAVDLVTGKTVAVKQLSADPQSATYWHTVARFEREGHIRISHPAVAAPIDCGQEGGNYFIIIPFVEGCDLEIVTSQKKWPKTKEVIELIDHVADGLAAIHAAGIVHRDVKPANIILRPDGKGVLCDFGISRWLCQPTITEGTAFLGSPPWTAPEQIDHAANVDHRADLYALGAVWYFLLTHHLPIRGTDPCSIAESIRNYTPPSPRQVDQAIPPQIDSACMKLLAKHPGHRFQSAAEFRQAIRTATLPHACSTCVFCGATLSGGAFCPRCGASLAAGGRRHPRCLACGSPCGEGPLCPECLRMFSAAGHRLTFHYGSLAGEVFRIPEGQYEVGREQLSSRDQYISRRQIRVNCVNGTVYLQHAGGANMTRVGGQPADAPTRLIPQLDVRIANNIATYSSN